MNSVTCTVYCVQCTVYTTAVIAATMVSCEGISEWISEGISSKRSSTLAHCSGFFIANCLFKIFCQSSYLKLLAREESEPPEDVAGTDEAVGGPHHPPDAVHDVQRVPAVVPRVWRGDRSNMQPSLCSTMQGRKSAVSCLWFILIRKGRKSRTLFLK